MDKNIALSSKQTKVVNKSFADRLASTSFIMNIAELFSIIMEEEVSAKKTLFILNAMVSGFMLVFPADMPIIARIIALLWFCLALLQCKAPQPPKGEAFRNE